MTPPPFEYHVPATVADAVQLLATLDDAKVLAGGQSLVPLLNFRLARPAHLVDVNRLPGLDAVRERDGGVAVCATVPQAGAEARAPPRPRCPLVPPGPRHRGHRVL